MNIPPDLSNAFDAVDHYFQYVREHSEDQLLDADLVAHLWIQICSCFIKPRSSLRITKQADGNRRYVLVEKTSKSFFPWIKPRHKCVFLILCREDREQQLNHTYWEHSTLQLCEYIRANFKPSLRILAAVAVGSIVRMYQYARGSLTETTSAARPFDLTVPELRLWCLKDVRNIFIYTEMSLLTLLLNK